MLAIPQRRDAVKGKPCRAAPHDQIAMLQPKTLWCVAAFQSAEQKRRGQPERNRDDRGGEIVLILVLMQGHSRARLIAVDQAGIRGEAAEPCAISRLAGQFAKRSRHCRPWLARLRIVSVVAISGAIRDPAEIAAVRHGDGHLMAARGGDGEKWRLLDDSTPRIEQLEL